MRAYDLSLEAEYDLRDIMRYTLDNWGEAQVKRYQKALNITLKGLPKKGDSAHLFS